MKYLIRIILTIPVLLIFGFAGLARMWKRGGVISINEKPESPNPEALRLLRALADLQNGPPLEKYRAEWEKVMREVWAFLNHYEDETPASDIPGVVAMSLDNGVTEGAEFIIGNITVYVARQAVSTADHLYIVTILEDGMGEGVEIGAVGEVEYVLPMVRAIAQIIENE